MKSQSRSFWFICASLSLATLPIRAVTINLTYDSSVSNSLFWPQIQPALGVVTNTFHVLFTNSSTVNITCYWGSVGPFANVQNLDVGASLSVSKFIEGSNFSYTEITNALRNARVNANDSNAVASLPASDPVATNHWWLPRAQAKALNLGTNAGGQVFFTSRTDTVNDGSISFADPVVTGQLYTFSPTNRAQSNHYDFIALAEHEISEIMGRTYELNVGSNGQYIPYDLFRFTNPGARCFNINATNVYFSVNNGTNILSMLYTNFAADPGPDACDWQPNGQPDAFEAYGNAGTILPLSPLDLVAMDVVGYHTPAFAPPRLAGTKMTNVTCRLSFTNATSLPFSVFACPNPALNLTNWTYLGMPAENPTGQYQFIDSLIGTNHLRFYRVRMP